jgi:hypothetical protein
MNQNNLSSQVKLFEKTHINENLSPQIKNFLDKLYLQLQKEIQKVCDAFFARDVSGNEIKGANKVFSAIERTWVGILNNAIIRLHENNTTLQEFAVWSDKALTGRCDMLFRILENENYYDVFVESKSYEYNDNWSVIEYKSHFKSILWQAYNYYEAEKEYYSADKTYLMAIIFQWVRKEDWLKKSIQKLQNIADLSEVDFIALYHADIRGVFVYGKIISVSKFKSFY